MFLRYFIIVLYNLLRLLLILEVLRYLVRVYRILEVFYVINHRFL